MVNEMATVPQPEPAWKVALLFPPQGQWSAADYFTLTHSTNRLVEFDDGCIEVFFHVEVASVFAAAEQA
jgi:hypothetical protein